MEVTQLIHSHIWVKQNVLYTFLEYASFSIFLVNIQFFITQEDSMRKLKRLLGKKVTTTRKAIHGLVAIAVLAANRKLVQRKREQSWIHTSEERKQNDN